MISLSEFLYSVELGLIWSVISIGVWIAFRVLNQSDLTCDGSVVVGSTMCGALLRSGVHWFWASLGGACGGAIAGLFTATLFSYGRISPILSGILVSFMLYSINLRIMGGVPNLALFGFETIWQSGSGLFIAVVVSSLMAMCVWIFLQTHMGLALRSIGSNPQLSEYLGICPKKMSLLGLALSNGCIGLGGALLSQHQQYADCGSGSGTLITALASIMIGERIFHSRQISIQIFAILVGSISYRLCIAFALHADAIGIQTQDLNLVTGLIVLTIMLSPRFKVSKC